MKDEQADGARLAERMEVNIVTQVAELPDRDSPDGWPEAMLVTAEELSLIVREEAAPLLQALTEAQAENARLRAVVDHAAPMETMSEAEIRSLAGIQRDLRMNLLKDLQRLRAERQAFVERCRDIRDGSPNAFYAHVDAFCKSVE